MRLSNFGIRGIVSATIAMLIFALAFLLSMAVGERSRALLEREIGRSLAQSAQSMVDKLDTDMWSRSVQVSVLSKLAALKDADLSRTLLDEMQARDPSFAWAGVTDASGKIVASSSGILHGADISPRPVYKRGIEGLFIGDVHDAVLLAKLLPNPSGEPMKFVDVSAPIHDSDGKLIGVLATHFSWRWAREVQERVIGSISQRRGLQTVIIGAEGTVLMGADNMLGQPLPLNILKRGPDSQNIGWGVERWPDGIDYLTGFAFGTGHADYEGLGWAVVARQPVSVAYATANALESEVLIWGGVMALVFSGVGWLAAGWIAHPIKRIAEAARSLRDGKPDTEIPLIGGIAEVSELSKTLRELVEALTRSKLDLRQMEGLASQDRLTGLPNRRFFEQYSSTLAQRTGGVAFNVLCLNLDGFKAVNDSLGHAAGDELLRQVAGRLVDGLRSGDVIARMGGDEFAVIVLDGPGGHLAPVAEIAQRLIASVNEPFLLSGQLAHVGCSIGIAQWPAHGRHFDTVMELADQALYAAKRGGRNRAVLYGQDEAFVCGPAGATADAAERR